MTPTVQRLVKADLCGGLSRSEVKRLYGAARPWWGRAGTVLCRRGEVGRGMYVVLDGLLGLQRPDRPMDWVGVGETFGERALLGVRRNDATAVAMLDSRVLVLTRPVLRKLVDEIPQLAVNLCRRATGSEAARPAARKARRTVGLALGGGGARGLAHLGVLKGLAEAGVTFDRMAGTSVGAVIAAFHASGYSPDETLDIFNRELAPSRAVRWMPGSSAVRIWTLFRFGGWRRKLTRYLGSRRLEDLKLPLATVATDLVTGTVVIREHGPVVDAVLESLGMPGATAPVWRDGQALVDGGVLNNLPADVVRSRGADVVIAVNVAAKLSSAFGDAARPRPGLKATMARVIAVQQHGLRTLPALAADLVLEPDVSHFKFGDFTQFDATAAAGAACIREHLPAVKAVIR